MMTTSPIFASVIGNWMGYGLCLILFVFFSFIIASVFTIPLSVIVCEYIQNRSLQLSIRYRVRREALSYVRYRAKDFNKYLAHPNSDEDLRFICEVLSHRKDDTTSVQTAIMQHIYRDLLRESPLHIKYYVDLLVAYGWNINNPFPFESDEANIKRRISWAPGTKPIQKVMWISTGTGRNRFIGNLAELLTLTKRYDAMYLLLCEYPEFSVSCRACFVSNEEDLHDVILMHAYKYFPHKPASGE